MKDYFRYREALTRLRSLAPLGGSFFVPPVPGKAYRFLLVAYDALGDFVLSTPAFKLIRDSYPGSEIEIICSRRNAELAESYGWFKRVHRVQLNGPLNEADWMVLCELKSRNFNFVINLFDEPDEFAIVKILSLLNRSNQFVSLPLRYKSRWQKRILKHQNYFVSVSDQKVVPFAFRILAIADLLGLKVSSEFRYEFPHFDQKTILAKTAKTKVLWNTAGSQRGNILERGSIEKMAHVIQANSQIECYVFDGAQAVLVREFLPDVKVLRSNSIMEAGSYISQMDLVVSTDTATVHLATYFDIPVLVMRNNEEWRKAFDPVYGVNQVVISKTEKLKDVDFAELSDVFKKMVEGN